MWAKNFTNFSDLIKLIKGIFRWNNLTFRHTPIEQFGLISSLSELNFRTNLQTFSVENWFIKRFMNFYFRVPLNREAFIGASPLFMSACLFVYHYNKCMVSFDLHFTANISQKFFTLNTLCTIGHLLLKRFKNLEKFGR